jgi:hypothetical protein
MSVGRLPSPRRAPLLWGIWLTALFALVRLACSFWPVTPLAARPGFAPAVQALEATAGPDTLVVVWPPEVSGVLQALPKTLTATDAVPLEPDNRRRYLQILVLGPAGFDAPPELGGARAEPRRRFEAIEIAPFVFASQGRVLFDLRASLGDAKVSVHGPQVNVDCTTRRADQGWDCPGQPPWNNVSPAVLTVEGREWPCVWAHPFAGHELVLDLGERRLGDRVELEAALSDEAATTPDGAAVQVRLDVAGVGTRSLSRSNKPGLLRDALVTPAGRTARITLTVTAPLDGRRHLGVGLRIVESAAAAPAPSR